MTSPEQALASAATLKQAYLTMERLQRKVEEYERARTEPIAVVGLGCRFPGGVVDGDSYWRLLTDGTDAVGEIPADRWDNDAYYDEEPGRPGKINTRAGGFLDRIDRFDHDFFGISKREALAMDPHQRLALEVSWEALENAGLSPAGLAGSRTGVFMGACSLDYVMAQGNDPADVSAYTSSGSALSFIPARIAYLLDLRGPNLSVDTACSSSLVAVHQACQSLRAGECDLALGGGVNVVLSPLLLISMSQFGSVSRQGRAKTFSDAADGYVRGEGCGVVVLKRLSDAVRDGDRVLAVLRGGAVNQDGRSAGITAPNGAAQRDVFRGALRASGVEAHQVSYIEAHGTGTRLGDPIEVEALADVYGREEGGPVYLGAVKTNIGHLEAAAGIAGLIKVVLCLEREAIPPNLHFERLNANISFEGTTFRVPTEQAAWPRGEAPRTAGVSSFGLSGTNAHLILQEAPQRSAPVPDERRPRSVLALSAKSETALLKLARRYQDRLTAGDDSLADVCFSANTGRSHFRHRVAAVGATRQEVASRLADFVRGEDCDGLAQGEATNSEVVFLFTGQGAQRVGMAGGLYRTQPTFRAAVDRCAEVLEPLLDRPLLSVLYPKDPRDPDHGLINDTAYAQPATFAVEYAMAELWRSWGVEPAAVIGHSFGECVAACVAGAMSLEDGLTFAVHRARLIQEFSKPGAMAAVFAPEAEVAAEIAGQEGLISIAAVNGPANTTVSGERHLVEAVCETFTARGVLAKTLHIASPGHSPLMEPVLDPLRRAAGQIRFSAPRIPLVSNVTGELWPWDQAPDADYWCRHTRQPVLFAAGVRTLRDLGYRTFLEVGPAPTLSGLVSDALPPDHDDLLLPSLRPKHDDWEVLLSTVSELYARGLDLDWAGFDRDYTRSRVPLPTYPFDPTRCWRAPRHFTGGPGAAAADTEQVAEDAAGPPADGERAGRRRGRSARGKGRTSTIPTAEALLALPAADRRPTLAAQFVLSVRAVLGSASTSVDQHEPLTGLGLDSLMAVELRNELRSQLGLTVPIADFLGNATIHSVAERIVERLEGGEAAGAAQGAPADAGDPGQGAAQGRPGDADGSTAIRRVQRVEDIAAELLAEIGELPDDAGGTGADQPDTHRSKEQARPLTDREG
ncbi:type I polyketide synthase [Wenjunlia vitaminophila]|uniref:type I polyketide synthase n=1 Tax=Wenjunlia vitaminophila TaxID=76728 RepID=UPI000367D023|nr:type I polyketide synthase [Wenjunlia vitaminophila]